MKRFTDTAKWVNPWFRKLAVQEKSFWFYVLDNCDNAGVWKVDLELASYQIGFVFEEKELLGAFDGRIRDIGKGRWWVEKFVPFQYGELSEASKPHRQVLILLEKHGLSKGYREGIHTLKDKDKDKKEGESEGKRPRPETEAEVIAFCGSISLPESDGQFFWQKWLGNGFKNNKVLMRDWQAVIRSYRLAGHLPSQQQHSSQQKPKAAVCDPHKPPYVRPARQVSDSEVAIAWEIARRETEKLREQFRMPNSEK